MSKKSRKLSQISPSQVVSTIAPEVSTGEAIMSATQLTTNISEEIRTAPVVSKTVVTEITNVPIMEDIVYKEDKSTVKLNTNDNNMIVSEEDKVQTKQVSQPVMFVTDYINDYLKYLSSTQHKNVHTSIKKFQRIINYAVKMQNNTDVLEEVYKFFKTERKKILRPDTALQGIHLLPSADREKIQHAYTLFLTVTAPGKTNPINYQFASKIFGTGNFLNFIMEKAK